MEALFKGAFDGSVPIKNNKALRNIAVINRIIDMYNN